MKLLVGTRSAHKLSEIRDILGGVPGLLVVGPDQAGVAPSPEEDDIEPFERFEENARSKAEYFFRRSGLPTVADDSGIEVDALRGAPGVRSKRFAPKGFEGTRARDEANNLYLLDRLTDVPDEDRSARYRCVVAFVDEANEPRLFRGSVEGRVLTRPRGTGGFGYDPLFHATELGVSFGEATAHEKHRVSHRGRAFRAFAEWLRTREDLGGGPSPSPA